MATFEIESAGPNTFNYEIPLPLRTNPTFQIEIAAINASAQTQKVTITTKHQLIRR